MGKCVYPMGDVDKVGDGVLKNKIGPIMIAEVEVVAGRGVYSSAL